MYCCQPYGFKVCLLGGGFHTFIRNISFPSPTYMRSHKGLASSLAHYPGRGFHAFIRNVSFRSPTDVEYHNPPLGSSVFLATLPNIWLWYHLYQSEATISRYCLFWFITYRRQPRDLKRRLLRRGFHSFTRNVSFFSSTNLRSLYLRKHQSGCEYNLKLRWIHHWYKFWKRLETKSFGIDIKNQTPLQKESINHIVTQK